MGPADKIKEAPPLPARPSGGADDHVAMVAAMVRDISLQSDPQAMIQVFRRRTRELYGGDESVSLSRRGLRPPQFRITRSTRWNEDINPWTQSDRLPVLEGGLLGQLLHDGKPRRLRDICVTPTDPAFEYLGDARSLIALPLFDGGEALNMVVRTSADPGAFDEIRLGDALLTANLIGRATSHLLMARNLEKANAELDHEMKRVADIQRALLPPRLPTIPGVDMAVAYKTAARAGGDYYDFFDLGDGRWGLLIADVSGHGTPAAVVMAMLRTTLHSTCFQCATPADLLRHANQQLCNQNDRFAGTFVTAFYGIYEPKERRLHYCCAGHNPPLLVNRSIQVCELNEAHAVPLAVLPDGEFPEHEARLSPGDTLLLYTDGITEAVNERGEMYGRERLLSCVREDVPNAQHIIDCVTHKLMAFTKDLPQNDDQTLLALRVR